MKKIIALTLVLSPLLTFAQKPIRNDKDIINAAISYGNIFISIIIALSVIYIIYGVFTYLIKGASEEGARKEGGKVILNGVVGLFIILSVWGLVAILRNSFSLDNHTPTEAIPSVSVRPF